MKEIFPTYVLPFEAENQEKYLVFLTEPRGTD
jgi:hypothetical protein